MRLTDYQRGSIFGFTIAAVAFGFTFWGQPYKEPANQKANQAPTTHTEQEGENPIVRWWTWTLTAESAGLYTFGLIGVGAVQAVFFVWQLVLIRKGLADTKEAADAAVTQAIVARQSLIASNRAWIKAGIPQIRFGIKSDSSGIHTGVVIPIQNIGQAPALKVSFDVWIDFNTDSGFDDQAFHSKCECNRNVPGFPEFLIFPGDTIDTTGAYIIPATADGTQVIKALRKFGRDKPIIEPLLVGCINYYFPIDNQCHQTRFVYRINFSNKLYQPADPLHWNFAWDEVSLGELNVSGCSYAD